MSTAVDTDPGADAMAAATTVVARFATTRDSVPDMHDMHDRGEQPTPHGRKASR